MSAASDISTRGAASARVSWGRPRSPVPRVSLRTFLRLPCCTVSPPPGSRRACSPTSRTVSGLYHALTVILETNTIDNSQRQPNILCVYRIFRSGAANGCARLYRVRGARPLLLQLEPVCWAQLASDGVFVLDSGALLVLWLGRTANLIEKIFGAKVSFRLVNSRYQQYFFIGITLQ